MYEHPPEKRWLAAVTFASPPFFLLLWKRHSGGSKRSVRRREIGIHLLELRAVVVLLFLLLRLVGISRLLLLELAHGFKLLPLLARDFRLLLASLIVLGPLDLGHLAVGVVGELLRVLDVVRHENVVEDRARLDLPELEPDVFKIRVNVQLIVRLAH